MDLTEAEQHLHVLISGAADSTIIVWLWQPNSAPQPYHIAAHLKVSNTDLHSLAALSDGSLPRSQAYIEPSQKALPKESSSGNGIYAEDCLWMHLSPGLAQSNYHLTLKHPFEDSKTLQGHKGPITSLAAQRLASGTILLASTAADENVLIWECAPNGSSTAQSSNGGTSSPSGAADAWGDWKLVQSIPWEVQLQHCAALTCLQGRPDWCGAPFTSCACELSMQAPWACERMQSHARQSCAAAFVACLSTHSAYHVRK